MKIDLLKYKNCNYAIGTHLSVVCLIILHYNGKISNSQLSKYYLNHTKGILLDRYINTYKSPITKKWYSDEPFVNILIDTIYQTNCDTTIDIESFLKGLNIMLNKNRNYCIDFLAFEIIKPLIQSEINGKLKLFLLDLFVDFPFDTYEEFIVKERNNLGSGYCCEEHDGDFDTYCYYQYKSPRVSEINEYIGEQLTKLKKGRFTNNELLYL